MFAQIATVNAHVRHSENKCIVDVDTAFYCLTVSGYHTNLKLILFTGWFLGIIAMLCKYPTSLSNRNYNLRQVYVY